MIKWVRNKWRTLKWRHWRANHKLPPEDWWDFKYTLADIIEQGLTGILYEGVTDWESDYHKQELKDLEFVLSWAKEFPRYESGLMASNNDDYVQLKNHFGDDVFIYTRAEYEAFEKKTQKAFKLLGKNIHTLWD